MATKEEIKKKLGLVGLPEAFKPKISPAPAPAPTTRQPSGEVEVFRDERGRLSGVTLPDGRTLLGLSPDEVRSISQKFAKEAETPVGAVEVAQAREEERKEEALTKLGPEQVGELKQIDLLKSAQDQADTITRLAQAGVITVAQAAQAISLGLLEIDPEKIESTAAIPIAKQLFATIGRVGTVEVFGVSLTGLGLGNAASRNIQNLQSDSRKMVTESQAILRTALTRSPNRPASNIYLGIESQKLLEEGIRTRYNNALISLKESPRDIAAGLDLYDSMSSDLRVVVENRQMMERYAMTGDPSEIINALGGFPTKDL